MICQRLIGPGFVRRPFVPVAVVVAAAFCPAFTTAGAAAAGAGAAGGARTASSGGTWGTAEEVPGTAALNTGGNAGIAAVSCGAAGDCGGGGWYTNRFGSQAFVAGATNDTWGRAIEVPGTAALNQGGSAMVNTVSCASAGNCSVGGQYTDSSARSQAFVAGEANGTWGRAIEVPGAAALNQGGSASIISDSCASAGNCSAAGWYADSSGHRQALLAGETNGTWGRAIEVPGTAALNHGNAEVESVSCASAGNCGAGGYYTDSSRHQQAFVVTETNGTWRTAIEVPGTATLNKGGEAQVNSVSCASAGNCSAGGYYGDSSAGYPAFVVTETNGTWGKAIQVPGAALLNNTLAQVSSVSCASAGNCSAGGYYSSHGGLQAFVVTQTKGTWGKAIEVPGTAALNKDNFADTTEVSCRAAGNCSAGGYYTDSSGAYPAFVVGQTNGTWGTAEEIPGIAALGGGTSLPDGVAVSCGAVGICSAGGYYRDHPGHLQAFVANEK